MAVQQENLQDSEDPTANLLRTANAEPMGGGTRTSGSAPSWQTGYDTLIKQMQAIQGRADVYKNASPLSADTHMQNIAKSLAKDYGITSIGDIGVRYETRPAYVSGSDESAVTIPEEQIPVYYNKNDPTKIIPGYKFASENRGDGYSEYNLQPVKQADGSTIAIPVQQYSKSGMGAFAQDIAPIMPVINMALLASGVPPLTVAAGNVAFQGAAGNIHDIGDVLRTGAPIVAADPGILGGVAKLYTAYQAFDKGQVLSGLASLASFGGMDQTANGLRFINAVKTGNIPGALTSLSQMPEVSGFELKDELGNVLKNADGTVKTLGNTKIGGENGITLGDASKAATIASTLMSSNPNYGLALQLAGDLAKSPDTVMAGKAATIIQTLSSPNPNPTLLYNAALGFAQTTNAKAPGTAPVDDKSANTAVRVAAGDTGDAGANAILSASNAVGQNLTGINDGLTVADLGTGVSDAGGNVRVEGGTTRIPKVEDIKNVGKTSPVGTESGATTNLVTSNELDQATLDKIANSDDPRWWQNRAIDPKDTSTITMDAFAFAGPDARQYLASQLPAGFSFVSPNDLDGTIPVTTIRLSNGERYAVTSQELKNDTSGNTTYEMPRYVPRVTNDPTADLRASDIIGGNTAATSGAATGAPAGASTGTPQLTAQQITALTIADTNGLLAGDLGANAGNTGNAGNAGNPSNSAASSNASTTSPADTVANNLGVLTSDLGANANPNGTPGGITGGTPGGTVGGTPGGAPAGTTSPAATTGPAGANLTLSGPGGSGPTADEIAAQAWRDARMAERAAARAGNTSGGSGLTSSNITALTTGPAGGTNLNLTGGSGGGTNLNLTGGPGGGALSSALGTLTTTQITALTSAPVTLPTSVITTLTSAPVVIPTTQLTSIVPALTSGPVVLPTSQVTSIVSALTSGLSTLTSTQITALTSTQITAATSGSSVLTSSQIGALTTIDPMGLQALPTAPDRYWRQTGAQGTGGKGGVRFFDWYDTPENRTMAPPAMASVNIPAITSQQAEAMVNPAKRYFNQSTNRYYTDPTGQWTPPEGWVQQTFKDGGNVNTKHFDGEDGSYVGGYDWGYDTSGDNSISNTGFLGGDVNLLGNDSSQSNYDGGGYDWAYGDEAAREEDINSYLRGLPSENASYGGGKDLTGKYQKDIKDAAVTGSSTGSPAGASNILKQLADAAKNNPKLTAALAAAGLGGLLGYMGRPKGMTPMGMQGLGLSQGQVYGALKGTPIKRAEGGEIDGYAGGGGLHYLKSAEDGMADRIPATIDNKQPAKLSGGEFVIPADVVSHLGNGNSEAGAKQLYAMMDRIRHARTGTKQQGKQINPAKFTPK